MVADSGCLFEWPIDKTKGYKNSEAARIFIGYGKNHFYISENSDYVIDIQEQYPFLPVEDTILIAEELGLNHPRHPITGEYVVMTTDFLVTVHKTNQTFDVARTIKNKGDLFNERILQKFEIEREYWKRLSKQWGIVTDDEIDKTLAKNISYVHSYYDISQFDAFKQLAIPVLEDLTLEFIKRLLNASDSTRNIANQFDKDMTLLPGSGLSIFYYLIIHKIIRIDLTKEIKVDETIEINTVNEGILEKVKFG